MFWFMCVQQSQIITLTGSSFVGVREEADSLSTSVSTPITSSSSELDRAINMLSARAEEPSKRASGSGMRAKKQASNARENHLKLIC